MARLAERPLGAPAPDPMLPAPFAITRTTAETLDTFTLELEPTAGGPASAPFDPGQFNMLYVFGVGEVPISISGDPSDPGKLVHTTRSVGAVTAAMKSMERGQALGVRGPFGSAWPVEAAEGRDLVLVAGGIGLAPLRPALYHVLAHRSRYNKVVLLYGARTPEEMLYSAELRRWRSRLDLEVRVTVDRATEDWRGNVGFVTTLIRRAPFEPGNTVAFVCGPELMMRFAAQELGQRGLPEDHIHVSLERNMKCAVGFCGHCQFGPHFVCRDGPVFPFASVRTALGVNEV